MKRKDISDDSARTRDEAAAVWVAIDALTPWAENPRINDKAAAKVAESIKRFGFGSPILARKADGEVIAGHTRLKAAKMLGLDKVPVRYLDLDPADAHLLAIADNKLGEVAEWDDAAVARILSDYGLDDAALAGFDQKELDALAASFLDETTEIVEDEAPAPPVDAITKPGDLWVLGEHRLLCGDCRNPEHVARLLGDAKINVAFTSPPYASQRKYDESSGFKPIPPDEYVAWFEAVQANVKTHLAADGSWFVNIKPHSEGLDTSLYVLDLVLSHAREWGWHFASEFCWERNGLPGKPARRFKNQFEPVYQFALSDWKFRPESVRRKSDSVPSYSADNHWSHGLKASQGSSGAGWAEEPSTGLAYPGNRLPTFATQTKGEHPASFPVGLPLFFIKAFTDPGDVVFDPFMGSGTTIIACEQTGRRGFGTEISPLYCDVIVKRWETLTGKKAERVSPHQTHA